MRKTSRQQGRAAFLLGSGIATACVMSACVSASGPAFVDLEVPAGKALVYFYRPKEMTGTAITHELYVNGEYQALIKRGGYFPYVAEPGELEILSTQAADSLQPYSFLWVADVTQTAVEARGPLRPAPVTVGPGETYYFKFKQTFAGFELVEVSSTVGRKEIQNLRQVPNAVDASQPGSGAP